MEKKEINAIALSACLALAATTAGCRFNPPAAEQKPDTAPRQSSSPAPVANSTPTPPSPLSSPGQVGSLLPAPVGFVNDYAEVIDDVTEQQLENRLRLLKRRANVEFAVATVETTGGQTIFDYTLAVARAWAIGSKETGDGLLLLLAVKDRKWHIQVSRSLEAVLPKETLAKVGMSANSLYSEGQHGAGIVKCVDGLIRVLAEKKKFKPNEVLLEPATPRE